VNRVDLFPSEKDGLLSVLTCPVSRYTGGESVVKKELNPIPAPATPTDPKAGERNGASVGQEMSLAKAKALIRKTSILHAGLFRRLAK
jgi:hypothetical protein